MKKVITILAILVVLVSAVFAAETHTIKVKANVEEVLPAFQLRYSTAKTNKGTDAVTDPETGAETTPAVAPALVNVTNGTHSDTATEPDVGFDLDAGGEVTVNAYVVNDVKTNKQYKLEFSDGVFTVKRNTTPGKLSPTKLETFDGDSNDAVKTGGYSHTAAATNNDKTADTTASLKASTNVIFSGKTGTGATTAIKVASATYTYTGDNTIDPNTAAEEWYYANIVMSITVV